MHAGSHNKRATTTVRRTLNQTQRSLRSYGEPQQLSQRELYNHHREIASQRQARQHQPLPATPQQVPTVHPRPPSPNIPTIDNPPPAQDFATQTSEDSDTHSDFSVISDTSNPESTDMDVTAQLRERGVSEELIAHITTRMEQANIAPPQPAEAEGIGALCASLDRYTRNLQSSLTTNRFTDSVIRDVHAYNGKDPLKLEEWLQDVDMAATATDTDHLTVAKLKARGLVRDIIEEAITEEADWSTSKERLRAKICNANKHTRISSFMEIRQDRDSLPAYIHRFRKDMKKASFTDTTAAIGIFLKGLTRAPILAPKVYEKNPTTLDEAISIVENVQAAVDATVSIMREEPLRVTQITSQEQYNRAPAAIISYRDYPNLPCNCNPQKPHVRLCQNARCNTCNLFGHWALDCPCNLQSKNNHGHNNDRRPSRSRSRGHDNYRSHSKDRSNHHNHRNNSRDRHQNNYHNHRDNSRSRDDRSNHSRSQSRDRYSKNSYNSGDRHSRDTNRYSQDKQRESSGHRNRSNSRDNRSDSRGNSNSRYNDRSQSPNRGRHGSSHNRPATPGVTFSVLGIHHSDSEDHHLN